MRWLRSPTWSMCRAGRHPDAGAPRTTPPRRAAALHRRRRLPLSAVCHRPGCAALAYLEALYRGRGRMECAIRDAKDTGLANLPSHSFAINSAWLTAVLIATDLLAWAKTLCLNEELANAQPQTAALHPAAYRRGARPIGAAHHPAAGCRLAVDNRPGHRVHPTTRMGPSHRLNRPTPHHRAHTTHPTASPTTARSHIDTTRPRTGP